MSRLTKQKTEAKLARWAVETYVLQVTPSDAPEVHRTLELRAKATLAELHEAVCTHFQVEAATPYRFHRAEDSGQVTYTATQSDQVALHDLGLTPGQRELTLSFFHDDDFAVVLQSVGAVDSAVSYPRLLKAQGERPKACEFCGEPGCTTDHPPLPAELSALVPALSEAIVELEDRLELLDEEDDDDDAVESDLDDDEDLDEVSEDDGPIEASAEDDEDDDDFDGHEPDEDEDALNAEMQEARLKAVRLANQLLDVLPKHLTQLPVLDHQCGGSLVAWLDELCYELPLGGLVDEAVTLALRASKFLEPKEFRLTAAFIQAHHQRQPAALNAIAELQAEFPNDLPVLNTAAEIYEVCNDLPRAETLWRAVLAHEDLKQQPKLQVEAMDRLADLLQETGRLKESKRLKAKADSLSEHIDWDSDDDEGDSGGQEIWTAPDLLEGKVKNPSVSTPLLPFQHEAPKVGRNDPCPCGSGKKHKKCCGMN